MKAVAGAPTEYSETVLAHFREPRNAGGFPAGTRDLFRGHAGAAKRGREIRIELKFATDGRLSACRYRVYGCPATLALCSVLSERLPGMTPQEALSWSGLALAEELGLPAPKRDAALLLEDALRDALKSYNIVDRKREAI